jgi:hypothetical protein
MNDESFVLYKFRPINKRLIESLVDRSLYFARPSTLNDPFDCCIDLKKALERAEACSSGDRKRFFSSILDKPEFFKTWHSTLEGLGVCAFSRGNRHTLLWSHYADDHKGVCLKYEFRAAYFIEDDQFHLTAAGNVDYLLEPLMEWLKSAPMDEYTFVTDLVHRYLKTKSPAWEYEEEARIFRHEPGVFKFKPSEPFLNQICFGLRAEKADIDLITKLAQTYTGCSRFSQMIRNETEFGFTEEAL